jgi:hypothetical protein
MRKIDVRRIESDLRNLQVSKCFRSYGSMIHFQLGELRKVTSGRHAYDRGEFGLMIEFAAWEITRHERRLADQRTWRVDIDRALKHFAGAFVRRAHFAYPSSELEFTSGLKLRLTPDHSSYGSYRGMGLWTLFRGEDVDVELDFGDRRLR